MHVFIDDSGDGGFKFDKGSSSHLVMAACVFRDPKEIEHLARQMSDCALRMSHRREFKYSRTSNKIKDRFFTCIEPVDFKIRAIIMDKRLIYSQKLRASPSALKSYAIRMLLTKTFGRVQGAKVVIDGQDTGAFGLRDSSYLMRMVNGESPGTIGSVTFTDSKLNVGVQLADMMAGAINKGVCAQVDRDKRHLEAIRHRTYQPHGTFWVFT